MKRCVSQSGLRTLNTFLNWAKKQKYLSEVPEFKKAKEEKKIPNVLTANEIVLLLTRVKNLILRTRDQRQKRMYHCHLLFMVLCMGLGLRRSEAFYLEWTDFDLEEEKKVYIRSKPPHFQIKEGREKDLPLPVWLIDYLQKLEKSSPRLFPPELYSDPSAMTRAFRRHLDALGLRKRKIKSCHSFRAGYASYLYSQGVDPETIRALMGHSSIETTMIYIESEEFRKKHAVDQISIPPGLAW